MATSSCIIVGILASLTCFALLCNLSEAQISTGRRSRESILQHQSSSPPLARLYGNNNHLTGPSDSSNDNNDFIMQATLLSPSGNGTCDSPDNFSGRVGVLYGIPTSRIQVHNMSTCSVNFSFVNHSTEEQLYYTNSQLTALLFALNESFLEELLYIESLELVGDNKTTPTISPIPRPPVAPLSPPATTFTVTFLLEQDCLRFVNEFHSVLSVPKARLLWSAPSCTPLGNSPPADRDKVSAMFEISEEANGVPLLPLPPSEPLRRSVEQVVQGGISFQVFDAYNIDTFSFLANNGKEVGVVVPLVYEEPSSQLDLGVFHNKSLVNETVRYVANLCNTLGVSNQTARVLFTMATNDDDDASSIHIVIRRGNNTGPNGHTIDQNWGDVVECLWNVSTIPLPAASSSSEGDDGSPKPWMIIVGIAAICAAAATIAYAVYRRKEYGRIRSDNRYLECRGGQKSAGGGGGGAYGGGESEGSPLRPVMMEVNTSPMQPLTASGGGRPDAGGGLLSSAL